MYAAEQQLKGYLESNIPESYNAWSSGTTYAFGDIARYGNYYYRSIIDGNVGNTPEYGSDEKWLTWRVSNAYAMLDDHSSTKTVVNETASITYLRVKIKAPAKSYTNPSGDTEYFDISDVILFSGVHGSKIEIEKYDGPGGAYDPFIIDLNNAKVDSAVYVFTNNLEDDKWNPDSGYTTPVVGKEIAIRIYPYRGRAEIANMLVGMRLDLGDTLFGFKDTFEDNSIWNKDDFGVSENIFRLSEEVYGGDVIYNNDDYTKIRKNVRNITGKVSGFVADESTKQKVDGVIGPGTKYGNLVVVGKLDSFTPITSNCVQTKASIQVREVI